MRRTALVIGIAGLLGVAPQVAAAGNVAQVRPPVTAQVVKAQVVKAQVVKAQVVKAQVVAQRAQAQRFLAQGSSILNRR